MLYKLLILIIYFLLDLSMLCGRIIVKRNDIDLQTCISNFDIHKDKIIRTQDSRDMGAKYLNEIDLGSREECLRLCCETEDCDVFVFEEKVCVYFTQDKKFVLIRWFVFRIREVVICSIVDRRRISSASLHITWTIRVLFWLSIDICPIWKVRLSWQSTNRILLN